MQQMAHFFPSRPLWLRIGIAIVAICVGIATLFGFIRYALDQFANCRNMVLSSIPSPDGTKAVYVFRQECNATVPDSVWASIAPTDRSFSPERNNAFVGLMPGAEIVSNWRGNDALEIAFIPGGKNFIKRDAKVGTIKIEYK
jgi:hypothetical protein